MQTSRMREDDCEPWLRPLPRLLTSVPVDRDPQLVLVLVCLRLAQINEARLVLMIDEPLRFADRLFALRRRSRIMKRLETLCPPLYAPQSRPRPGRREDVSRHAPCMAGFEDENILKGRGSWERCRSTGKRDRRWLRIKGWREKSDESFWWCT